MQTYTLPLPPLSCTNSTLTPQSPTASKRIKLEVVPPETKVKKEIKGKTKKGGAMKIEVKAEDEETTMTVQGTVGGGVTQKGGVIKTEVKVEDMKQEENMKIELFNDTLETGTGLLLVCRRLHFDCTSCTARCFERRSCVNSTSHSTHERVMSHI